MKCYTISPSEHNAMFLRCNDRSIVDKRVAQVDSFVLQLYLIKEIIGDRAVNEPWATGVLVVHNNQKFLLSAGHVFDGIKPDQIAFTNEKHVYHVEGEMCFTSLNHKVNMTGDLSFVKLAQPTIDILTDAGYKFLPDDQMYGYFPAVFQPVYMLYGFPVSKSKKNWKEGTLKVSPLLFITEADKNLLKYKKLGFHTSQNLLLEYHYRKVRVVGYNTKAISPDFHGMSGCGVWILENDVPYLVGIAHTYDKVESVIAATRIEIIVREIDRKFPVL